MLKHLILTGVVSLFILFSRAATVDTISIYSNAMHKTSKCVVIVPDPAQKKAAYPVVYLLHGYGGWYSNWILRVPQLKDYADLYQMMIVCPDGANSWYVDSPVDTSIKYETYVGSEVPAYIDAHYPTLKDRKGRAITGLSMGGHGGLFLGMRHSDFFGACGSISGGVDLRPFPKSWDLSKRVGDTTNNAANWINYSVIHIVDQHAHDSLAIIIDCGTDDFFYSVNRQLHEKMLALKIPHDFIERPGQHDWNYWRNSIQYQLLFFSNYFKRK
jgi:S-formylglutathione hydrolase FrmB